MLSKYQNSSDRFPLTMNWQPTNKSEFGQVVWAQSLLALKKKNRIWHSENPKSFLHIYRLVQIVNAAELRGREAPTQSWCFRNADHRKLNFVDVQNQITANGGHVPRLGPINITFVALSLDPSETREKGIPTHTTVEP